jgi:hypothetical protein
MKRPNYPHSILSLSHSLISHPSTTIKKASTYPTILTNERQINLTEIFLIVNKDDNKKQLAL